MRDIALAVFGWTLVLGLPVLGAIALVIKALRDRHSTAPDWTADLVPDARPWRHVTTDEG